MKKVLSLVLTLAMLVSLVCLGTLGASANGLVKTYEAAADGDLLYEAKFGETSGVYQPYIFGAAMDKDHKDHAAKNLVVTPSADGTEISFTPSQTAAGRVFYGGKVDGLTLGAGKKYTIELEMKFPSGNAGFYFNIGDPVKYDPANPEPMTQDTAYLDLFGLYGTTKTSGICFTMSYGAGGKMNGELVSDSAYYTDIPQEARVGNDVYTNVKVEIDGYFYAVYLNDKLYDKVTVPHEILDKSNNLGIVFYLYNKTAKLSAKNVKVYKGVKSNIASVYTPNDNNKLLVGYDAAKLGAKLYDFNFAATSGVYVPHDLQVHADAKSSTLTVSPDGKSVHLKHSNKAAAYYWGSKVDGLKITDSTKYTFTYKIKTVGASSAGIGYNLNWPFVSVNNSSRLNFYGNFNDTTSENVALSMKFADHGTKLNGQDYADLAYDKFQPTVDADGFTDIALELDGYKASLYIADSTKNGELTLFRTVDLTKEQYKNGDDLALWIYVYNADREVTLKDCSLYKGLTVSETYPDTPDTPVTPVPTGDNSLIIVAVVASIALASFSAIVVRRKKEEN